MEGSVFDEDGVLGGLEDGPEAFFALLEGLGRLVAPGDIPHVLRRQDNLPGFTQDGKSAEFPGFAVQEIDLFGLLRLTAGEDLVDMAALAGALPVMKNPVALGPAPPGLLRHHAGLVPVGHDDVEVPVDDGEHIRNGAEDVAQNGVGGRRGVCRGRAVRSLCRRAFPGLRSARRAAMAWETSWRAVSNPGRPASGSAPTWSRSA